MLTQGLLSDFEKSVLIAVRQVASAYPYPPGPETHLQNDGWVTNARVRDELSSNSLATRKALQRLAVEGFLQRIESNQAQFFRLTALGQQSLESNEEIFQNAVPIYAKSSDWTGVIEPVKILQVLAIVSEIEDVAEGMRDNVARAQTLGLVASLKILLEMPNPPREGLIALVRDPAVANIVQIATFLAAFVAALRA